MNSDKQRRLADEYRKVITFLQEPESRCTFLTMEQVLVFFAIAERRAACRID